jgi:hypothetical protein
MVYNNPIIATQEALDSLVVFRDDPVVTARKPFKPEQISDSHMQLITVEVQI